MHAYSTIVPGYPRVGPRRAYKSLLEKYWSGVTSAEEFETGIDALRTERLKTQVAADLDFIPCGDFSLYDHVLDTALTFGCLPDRFAGLKGHEAYFAAARGLDGIPPQEMTKWFDTNYHYLVPELPESFSLAENRPLDTYRHAKGVVGDKASPILLGPFTFLRLARLSAAALANRLEELVLFYAQVIDSLIAEGASHITLDESALATDLSDEEVAAFCDAYRRLDRSVVLQIAYGDVAPYWSRVRDLPVKGFALDFVRGQEGNLAAMAESGFSAEKLLVAGVVDGRNIWRSDLAKALSVVNRLSEWVSPERTVLGSSCTLLHLPDTVRVEEKLPEAVKAGLCFAQERLGELRLLSQAARNGVEPVCQEWDEAQAALEHWRHDAARMLPSVQTKAASLTEEHAQRLPYAQRKGLQVAKLGLPPLPTTTIGSFPQTNELRQARAVRKKDEAAYQEAIRNEIRNVVALQEEIGLDVLVHGEPERNDMVQFFGDQMRGFATTTEGWVQSYGSRCVRPPIIFGDIDRHGPMTVREISYAQSLTQKPVKGMLTGPITILQWSFVREDISRSEVATQIALAIRDEVSDLEVAGIGIVQIDEAAYREGLPLRRIDWPEYLGWAVRAFRIASSGVRAETQIHTHMCYSEFGDIIEAIAALDADVISIEDTRSDGALLQSLRDFQYPAGIGPGVYDIHSPNVPDVESIVTRLRSTLTVLPPEQIWVNPDCGLKTRRYEEVTPSLTNMVVAARRVRDMCIR